MEIAVVGDDLFTIGFRLVGIEKWFNVSGDISVDEAVKSAAERAEVEEYKVKTYKKPIKPFDLLINELLENINIEINLDPRLKFINSKLEKHLKLIDPKKNNVLLYCFECEVK